MLPHLTFWPAWVNVALILVMVPTMSRSEPGFMEPETSETCRTETLDFKQVGHLI